MKILKSHGGLLVALAAVLWAFFSVWLSAHQYIPPYREGMGWSYFFALFGSIYHWCNWISRSPGTLHVLLKIQDCDVVGRGPKVLHVLLAIVTSIATMSIVHYASSHADQMFTFWKLRSISKADWQTMAADLDVMTRQTTNDHHTISAGDLPPSFRLLGTSDESNGATITRWEDGMVTANVGYGGRYRSWGLAIGPSNYFLPPYRSAKFKFSSVSSSASFFVGSGG